VCPAKKRTSKIETRGDSEEGKISCLFRRFGNNKINIQDPELLQMPQNVVQAAEIGVKAFVRT